MYNARLHTDFHSLAWTIISLAKYVACERLVNQGGGYYFILIRQSMHVRKDSDRATPACCVHAVTSLRWMHDRVRA